VVVGGKHWILTGLAPRILPRLQGRIGILKR
jgi:hypothetical protein